MSGENKKTEDRNFRDENQKELLAQRFEAKVFGGVVTKFSLKKKTVKKWGKPEEKNSDFYYFPRNK